MTATTSSNRKFLASGALIVAVAAAAYGVGRVYPPLGPSEGTIAPAGAPMQLTITGTEQRRSLALVLYESSQPWSIPVTNWTPKGLCNN